MSLDALRSMIAVTSLFLGAGTGIALAADAQPAEDERCVAQCDAKADKCMAGAGGDEKKQKACDDDYEECLSACK
ncbi:MAG: hypothetical protein IT483_12395 [Gammaproteobacteria bacterium]|nr:hypothetical protein [Gammaproteobacteria bacterium]